MVDRLQSLRLRLALGRSSYDSYKYFGFAAYSSPQWVRPHILHTFTSRPTRFYLSSGSTFRKLVAVAPNRCQASFVRRFAPANIACHVSQATSFSARLLAEKNKTCTISTGLIFFNRQLSILPGRFQPSTFDV